MAGEGDESGSSTVPHTGLDFVPIDPPYQQTSSHEEAEEEALLSASGHAAGLDMEPHDDEDDDDDDDEQFVPSIPRLGLVAHHNLFPFRTGRVASPPVAVKKLETRRYHGPEEGTSADGSTGCVICIQDFEEGDEISVMPCPGRHRYHQRCLDVWFTRKRLCPLCRHALPAELQRGIS